MTNIEQKALKLVNEAAAEFVVAPWTSIDRRSFLEDVVCRAIEQHEAFRKEVSNAVEAAKRVYGGHREAFDQLDRFIITKPDPLVEAVKDILDEDSLHNAEEFSEELCAALAKRGLEIREKSK